MLDYFKEASNIEKGLFIMGVGIAGVFLVLIVFYLLIKLLGKAFPNKGNGNEGEA